MALAALLLIVAVVVLSLVLLQTQPVATRAANALAGRFSPWPDASLTVVSARLRGTGRLTLTGVRLTGQDGATMLTIDSAAIHLRPLGLLRGRLDMPSFRVVGADATLRQQADTTWDLLGPFASTDLAPEGEPLRIRIDRGTIARSRLEARFLASTDSTLRVEGIALQLSDLVSGHGFDVRIDTLGARVYPPLRPGVPADVSARLVLAAGVLTADHFLLTSDSSRVSARGTLVMPGADTPYISNLDFRVTAEPLDFRDISALVPAFSSPGSLRFEGRVTGTSQLARFEAQGQSFDGATFEATGALTPSPGDSLQYRLDATLRGLRLDRWMPTAPVEGPVDAVLSVDLLGSELDSLSGTASLRLGPMRVAETALAPTTLEATMRLGAARYTVTGGVAGLLALTGNGSMRPLDSAAVATLAAQVRQLADTSVGPVRISGAEGTLHATWARATGVTTLEGRLRAEPGQATFTARATMVENLLNWTVTRLTVADLDLSRLNPEWPVSRIDASMAGSGRGILPEALTGTSVLTVAPSEIAGERVDTATMNIALDRGTVTVRGNARAPRGVATVAAVVWPFRETLAFQVDSLRFRDVVLDTATADGERPRLAGLLVASGTLPEDQFPQVTGTVDLDPTTWNAARVEGGRVIFAIEGSEASADARLRTGQGLVTFAGTAQLTRSDSGGMRIASGQGSGRAALPDLGALLGRDSANAGLDAEFNLRADGSDPLVTTWLADITATGNYDAVTLDTLRLDARLAAGVLHLDTLLLRSNVATGDGSGTLAVAAHATPPDTAGLHIRIVADTGLALTEALPLDHYSLRGGTLTLDATNSDGGIDARARLRLLGLISDGPWGDSILVDGTARIVDGSLATLISTLSGNDVGYGTLHLEGIDGTVEYESSRAEFDMTLVGDDQHQLRIAGTAIPRERSITLAEMAVALNDRGWSLAAPATVVLQPRFVIRNFALQDGEQQVVVDGTIDRAGTQDLSVTFRNFPIQGFAEFAGYDGLDGELNGTVGLSGPATRVALASDLELRLMGTTGTIKLSPATDGRLGVEARFEDEAGQHLLVDGSVPFVLSLAEGETAAPVASGALALTVAADSFALGWLAPLLLQRGVERLEGALRADIRVSGSYGDPVMAGTAALMRGRIDYARQGVSYRDVAGEFTFDGPRITVTSLRATSGGTATASGEILMADAGTPLLNLDTRFTRFRAVENEWGRIGVSGRVQITGDLLAPTISGHVQLVDTDIYADPVGQGGAGQAAVLTEEDYRMLSSFFGYRVDERTRAAADPLAGMALELDVTLGTDAWLRRRTQPEMRIQLDGSLDVRKAAEDSIRVFGTIEVLPERSYFEQFGRRFELSSGTVTFNGPMMGWIANFQARYPVPSPEDASAPQVVITLTVQGEIDDLKLTLGAEPPMETADMLSYLATGRPAASAAAFGGAGEGGIGGFGASLAAGHLAGVLEESAAEHVGLDVIEIRHNGIKGATVVAGRYVTPRLFVGFEQPLTLRADDDEAGRTAEQTAEVKLEYSAYRWLVLHLQGGQSRFEFFLRFRRSF